MSTPEEHITRWTKRRRTQRKPEIDLGHLASRVPSGPLSVSVQVNGWSLAAVLEYIEELEIQVGKAREACLILYDAAGDWKEK